VDQLRVVDVAFDPRAGGSGAIYTYLEAENPLEVGQAVIVPLGTRSMLGYVIRAYTATPDELGMKVESLRPVLAVVENIGIPPILVDLAEWVAEETLSPKTASLAPCMPPGVKERLTRVWKLDTLTDDLTPGQREVVKVVQEAGGEWMEPVSQKPSAATLRTLRLLRNKKVLSESLQLVPFSERRETTKALRLIPETDRLEQFLVQQGKRKPAQAVALMCLMGTEAGSSFLSTEIKAMAGVTDATIRGLVSAGLLMEVDDEAVMVSVAPELNPTQRLAAEAITESIRQREAQGYLLFGVTGSGKTEVYLRAMAECLRSGRQALYLVPEIALASQAIAQLRSRFGRRVSILHSELSPKERLTTWLTIRKGESPIVLGARSALFAPLTDVGLIIVDEEHEGTYKQESSPRYHARTVARRLAGLHQCPVVLGSATPSIESMHEAEETEESGRGLRLLTLPHRAVTAAKLPDVEIHDLAGGYKAGSPSIFTPVLHDALAETLESGHQAILFLNRRAYAPFLLCRDCGFRWECPNCATTLSFHRRVAQLKCHHCGFQSRAPEICPECDGNRVAPLGVGTEKVEEFVRGEFPEARVGRLDRDIAQRRGAIDEVMAGFRSGDLNVLVGTQMVAKGLDFPNVTLVGVIAADVSLNLPDFRASERTFQLLCQVAGRAGRGGSNGRVIIQTFNPHHPAVVAAATHDYHSIYESILDERRKFDYPPFGRIVNLVFSGENLQEVTAASQDAAHRLRHLNVLGPVNCVLERLQSRWRRHLIVKLRPGESPSEVGRAIEGFAPKDVSWFIDVDANSLM
jgi:primosomal protein N' (replication factor Y)